jgi:hypothetical protein
MKSFRIRSTDHFIPVPVFFRILLERLHKAEQKVSEQVQANSLLLEQLKQVQKSEESLKSLVQRLKGPSGVVRDQDGVKEEEVEEEEEEKDEPAELSNEEIALGVGDVVDRSRPVIPVLLFACNRYDREINFVVMSYIVVTIKAGL